MICSPPFLVSPVCTCCLAVPWLQYLDCARLCLVVITTVTINLYIAVYYFAVLVCINHVIAIVARHEQSTR